MNTSASDHDSGHPELTMSSRAKPRDLVPGSMKLPDVIGLSGRISAGKDSLAEYLVKNYGYTHVSTGDIVRAEATRLYGNIERETLQKVGPAYKAEKGAGIFVEMGLEKPRPIIVSGIRSMGEYKAIKQAGGVMVFVDADPRLRYERMKKRARDAEAEKSFEEFIKSDEREKNAGTNDADFRVDEIDEKADIHLDNSGTREEFYEKAIEKLSSRAQSRDLQLLC